MEQEKATLQVEANARLIFKPAAIVVDAKPDRLNKEEVNKVEYSAREHQLTAKENKLEQKPNEALQGVEEQSEGTEKRR